ncbi:hypothetical protein DP113_14930 [Brasilonema octagenarum UFV-E1]|uniref:Uncharacterized protein n=1 Tax=Brasilonema sennae CENA114 TaxID=415709 RepID=A0A856MFK2_9CYAN|nr:hypothetical protein [Brasilonema sennae]QDL09030.1 hypothetical protein DP114_14990 [Brasilonema sennae CENA114]QDL15387.1 hypothetical protein DP113_14930 [Brasilonema octagenarum UFV-E1]
MSHFNLKSLTFYAVAISSVLLLFKVVTAYGESSLKAPLEIDSNYRLMLSEKLPICDKSGFLLLNLQQSGIYLNGLLVPDNSIKTSKVSKKSSLMGKIKNQQLNLSGTIQKHILCNTPNVPKQTNLIPVKLQIQLVKKGDLIGKINVSDNSKTIGLTAIPQKTKEKSEEPKNH